MSEIGKRSQRVRIALEQHPLYFILDESICGSRDPLTIAASVMAGGVRMLQLRFKSAGNRELLSLARKLRSTCDEHNTLLVINDRPDIAVLANADGVHIGEHDFNVIDVRSINEQLIVGATARTAESALQAQKDGADYLGCGSVFASSTKSGLPVIGIDGLTEIASAAAIPVAGIGGIILENCAEVMQTGAAGFCSIAPFADETDAKRLAEQYAAAARNPTL